MDKTFHIPLLITDPGQGRKGKDKYNTDPIHNPIPNPTPLPTPLPTFARKQTSRTMGGGYASISLAESNNFPTFRSISTMSDYTGRTSPDTERFSPYTTTKTNSRYSPTRMMYNPTPRMSNNDSPVFDGDLPDVNNKVWNNVRAEKLAIQRSSSNFSPIQSSQSLSLNNNNSPSINSNSNTQQLTQKQLLQERVFIRETTKAKHLLKQMTQKLNYDSYNNTSENHGITMGLAGKYNMVGNKPNTAVGKTRGDIQSYERSMLLELGSSGGSSISPLTTNYFNTTTYSRPASVNNTARDKETIFNCKKE